MISRKTASLLHTGLIAFVGLSFMAAAAVLPAGPIPGAFEFTLGFAFVLGAAVVAIESVTE